MPAGYEYDQYGNKIPATYGYPGRDNHYARALNQLQGGNPEEDFASRVLAREAHDLALSQYVNQPGLASRNDTETQLFWQQKAKKSKIEEDRRAQVQKQGSLEWNRIAKVFSDPKANLTADQKAQVLNQFQAQYGASSLPNPIDLTTAEDESDPKIQIANARQKIRGIKGYDPFWDSLIKTNKDGEVDFKDLIEWRKLEGNNKSPAQDLMARKQAYEFDKKQHEAYKPEPPDAEATPEEIDQYKESFARWQGGQRNIYNQYFGDTEQHKIPTPPMSEPVQSAPPDVQPQARAQQLGVSFIKSSDQYDELIQQGLLSPGDQFVDDAGNVWTVDDNGTPKSSQ